jgi:hypothetical protein
MTPKRRKVILAVALGLPAIVGASFLVLVFFINFLGLNSFHKMIRRVREATPEQWHAWAALVIERSRTNSAPMPPSQWPPFARRLTTVDASDNWELDVNPGGSNVAPHIMLFSLGGFESIGVDVGSPSFVESEEPDSRIVVEQIYPGVYARRSR